MSGAATDAGDLGQDEPQPIVTYSFRLESDVHTELVIRMKHGGRKYTQWLRNQERKELEKLREEQGPLYP